VLSQEWIMLPAPALAPLMQVKGRSGVRMAAGGEPITHAFDAD
jgi:hypothetical protein